MPSLEREFAHIIGRGKLNNGSFGASPLSVRAAQTAVREQLCCNFDQFFFQNQLPTLLLEAEESIAEYLGSNPEDTCLVENATAATSVIGFHWMWKVLEGKAPNNKILTLNHVYKACEYNLRNTVGRAGATIVHCNLPFPMMDSAICLELLEESLKLHRPRFAFLNHISSQPVYVMPIREMIQLCRMYGVEEIAVDGAHTVGSLKMDLSSIGDFDWYFSNLHKWGFLPLTGAVLVGQKFSEAHHPVVSWKYKQGLKAESSWPGTRDCSAYTVVPNAVKFLREWKSPEGELSYEYNKRRCLEVSEMLAKSWNTGQTFNPDLTCGMSMVRIPDEIPVDDAPGVPTKAMRSRLRYDYGLEVAVGNFGSAGNYIRLSHHVYNKNFEYTKLRDAILEIREDFL